MDLSEFKSLYPNPKLPIILSCPETSSLCILSCVKKLEFSVLERSLTPSRVQLGSSLSLNSKLNSVIPSPGNVLMTSETFFEAASNSYDLSSPANVFKDSKQKTNTGK